VARQYIAAASERMDIAATITSSTALTLSAWFRPTSATGGFLLALSDPINAGQWFAIIGGTTACSLQINDNAGGFGAPSAAVVAPGWHHLAGRFISSTSRQVWLDGTLRASDTTSSTPVRSSPNCDVGCLPDQAGPRIFFDGWIAFPTVHDVALDPNELLALAQGADPITIRPPRCVASWDDFGRDRTQRGNNMTTVKGRTAPTRLVTQQVEGPSPVRSYGPRRVLRVG